MYKITSIIVKPKKNKGLCQYFKGMCENYTYLKNVANFHIRQHMSGLQKPADKRHENEAGSIELFRQYIPELTEHSQAYYDKKVYNILNDDRLSDNEKQEKLSKVKPPVTYTLPDAEKWFLGYNVLEGVIRLCGEYEPYGRLPAQVNQHAIKDVCTEWKSYFKANDSYKKNPSLFTGKPRIPRYYKGSSTVTLTNINCRFHFTNKKCVLSFQKTDFTLNLGRCIKDGTKLKQVEVVPVADYFKVIVTTEEADVVKETKEPKRVASIDIGGKNTVTLVTNVEGLKPFIINSDFLKGKNDNWMTAIDKAKSTLRKGLKPDDYTKPFISKKIKRMWFNRENFLSDYFHKICLHIIRYCKEHDIDTLVIGRNKGLKQGIDLGKDNNREFQYIPFTKLYNYLFYLCERNSIGYIETEESYTSKASFFDRDEIPVYKKGDDKVHSFSGKRTDRDTYIMKDSTAIHADINGSLNIMRKAVPELCDGIKIEDMMAYDTIYPPYKRKSA